MNKLILKETIMAMVLVFICDGYLLTAYCKDARSREIRSREVVSGEINTVSQGYHGETGGVVTINGAIQTFSVAEQTIKVKNAVIRVNSETDIRGQRDRRLDLGELRENQYISVKAIQTNIGLVATEIHIAPY